ncbi:MAG: acylneuraminate cytidylyltransferase family protein, partial [Cyclobacteriaceae bacterium]|nr:acylneuraminate cytidylyltransferase family protein [Cyclobacteriaceae bacterium]
STDDVKIKECAEQTGLYVPFIRPSHLATDTSGTYEVLLHAVEFAESQGYVPDTLVLLQPTSPFRTAKHIKDAMQSFSSSDDMVVSVKETKSNPYYVLFEDQENGYLKKSKEGDFIRRQDCPQVWEYNGAIYIINIALLKKSPVHRFQKVKKYVMDERSSHDIDSKMDWLIAEHLAQEVNLK